MSHLLKIFIFNQHMGSVMQGYDSPLHVQLDIFTEDPHIMFRLFSNLFKKNPRTQEWILPIHQ